MELVAVGTVQSPLTDVASAPKQGDEGAPEAWLVFAERFADALDGIAAGDELLVLTWLDRAGQKRAAGPPTWRTPPILSRACSTLGRPTVRTRSGSSVPVVSIDGLRLRVRGLEAVNGTPIIDVKPPLSGIDER